MRLATMDSETFSGKKQPYCRLCLGNFGETESRLNLFSTGKSRQEVPLDQKFLQIGLALPRRKDVSQSICMKCHRKFQNILKCFETLGQWRQVVDDEQPSSDKRLLSPSVRTPTGHKKKKQRVLTDITPTITTRAFNSPHNYIVVDSSKENSRRNLAAELSETVSFEFIYF